jgi:hypothetical protein
MRTMTGTWGLIAAVLCVPAAGWAQTTPSQEQNTLSAAHSATQKLGVATIVVTGALGITLAVNHDTLFGDGRCTRGNPVFGRFGCDGLSLVHFGFAATTLGLFVASEVLAEQMHPNPYFLGSTSHQNAMQALRWTNAALFVVQPLLGIFAAHPRLLGIPEEHRSKVSRVLRTIHLGVGFGLATTYSFNAALQW